MPCRLPTARRVQLAAACAWVAICVVRISGEHNLQRAAEAGGAKYQTALCVLSSSAQYRDRGQSQC